MYDSSSCVWRETTQQNKRDDDRLRHGRRALCWGGGAVQVLELGLYYHSSMVAELVTRSEGTDRGAGSRGRQEGDEEDALEKRRAGSEERETGERRRDREDRHEARVRAEGKDEEQVRQRMTKSIGKSGQNSRRVSLDLATEFECDSEDAGHKESPRKLEIHGGKNTVPNVRGEARDVEEVPREVRSVRAEEIARREDDPRECWLASGQSRAASELGVRAVGRHLHESKASDQG